MNEAVILVQILSVVFGVGVVQTAGKAGAFQGRFKSAFLGGGTTWTAGTVLSGFSGVESYLRACLDGDLGASGIALVASTGFLVFVWAFNFVQVQRVVQ
jgi:hypothetical protein